LAVLSTIAVNHTSDPRSLASIVHGWQYAFAGAAVFVGLSLVVFLALLRKRHVARIEAEVETEPAALAA
jgi:hypothetical protein